MLYINALFYSTERLGNQGLIKYNLLRFNVT